MLYDSWSLKGSFRNLGSPFLSQVQGCCYRKTELPWASLPNFLKFILKLKNEHFLLCSWLVCLCSEIMATSSLTGKWLDNRNYPKSENYIRWYFKISCYAVIYNLQLFPSISIFFSRDKHCRQVIRNEGVFSEGVKLSYETSLKYIDSSALFFL